MQLYSAAIEHYNRTRDEENYAYYIEKLQKLNTDIRSLIEREERQIKRVKDQKQKKAVAKKAAREEASTINSSAATSSAQGSTAALAKPVTSINPGAQ
mmetsp:Transcript_31326/g.38788  ORF Transcript_31326/g.38788 Transcript_31326/m.38788 type:complete len:98 (-) Transcript_31326:1644-1937(-)